MLPLMMLQPTDLATFAAEPNSADLLPQDAIEPVVAFADLLQGGLQPPAPTAMTGGSPVPLAGNGLPPMVGLASPTAGPGGESALPLPALEQIPVDARPGSVPVEARIVPPAAEGRLPALPTLALTDPTPRTESSPALVQAPGQERLVVDNLQQQVVRQASTAPRTAPGPENAARPQLVSDIGIQRFAPDSAVAAHAATAGVGLAETAYGRALRPAVLADSQPAAVEDSDVRQTALLRDRAAQPGIAPEFRQPAPAVPVGQPAQITVDGMNPGETPLPQASAGPQGLQTAAAQLSQAPTQLAGSAAGAAAPQPQAPIDIPVRDTAWSGVLGERVLVMANNQLQSAEIRLTPAELGPLRVQVAVEDGAANVTFHAQHAVTREAIEQALPRLRELFAENGLTLNQADVGEQAGPGVQDGKRDAAGDGASADGIVAQADEDSATEEVAPLERGRSRPDGLVDTFA